MASSNSNYFKKYNRENRTQLMEASFADGIFYTKAPLDAGKTRLLVNYDLMNEGASLSVRKGMRTECVYAPFTESNRPTLTSDLRSTICKDVVTEDNTRYKLAVVSSYKSSDATVANSNLKTATHEMWVMKEDASSAAHTCLDEYGIDCKEMYAINISNAPNVTSQKSYYYVPNISKINGITITDKTYISRPIGCFAWDDNYYNFNDAGKLIRSKYDTTNAVFTSEQMTPMSLTVKEAYSTGFNMLLDQPYQFSDQLISGSIQLDGILLLDSNNEIVPCPLMNKTYKMRIYHQAQSGKKYKFVIKYREVDTSSWNDVKTIEQTIASPIAELSIDFSSPSASIVIQIEAFLYSGSAYAETAENMLTVGASFSAVGAAERTNQKLVKINIHKASELVYWKNYLWLYGMPDAPKTLFHSGINEPTYFPYPNNTNIFDEPIVHCVPFKESMLVFTKSKLFQMTLTDGTFYANVIQDGLNFTDFDASMIRCVKNMVFFKSGDYYYMVVPKTLSLQNDYALAPVSKYIEYFLDDFENNIRDMIDLVYDYGSTYDLTETLTLVHHYNYLNYEDVYNTYVFATNKSVFINVVLLYNTNNRTWRFYTYESESIYAPIREDATKVSEMYTPTPIKINVDGTETTTVCIQQFFADESTAKDFFIPKTSKFTKTSGSWIADGGTIETSFNTLHTFKNWTILDTGYRDSDVDYKKRYRELQFKFNNTSGADIKFSMEFVLDGETRVNKYTYNVERIDSGTNEGLLYISRSPVENLELPGETALGASSTDTNAWTLSNSVFPEIAFWKARMRVSGKGNTPRFRLMSRTEERYEILGYNWVYRLLYSR